MFMNESRKKIRVLCVDDSKLIRAMLTQVVNNQPDMEMVGAAPDPLAARDMIKELNPDVVTLDVEMPRMDGLDFLGRIMRLRPMPVIMVSSLTLKNSDISIRALELGAVDIVAKPHNSSHSAGQDSFNELPDKIRAAAISRPRTAAAHRMQGAPVQITKPMISDTSGFGRRSDWLIAIGASTGGPEAIARVLEALPEQCPPIVMAQHMPGGFTASFVQRLDRTCALHVHEATDNQPILPGHAYLAPGGIAHLGIKRTSTGLRTELLYTDPVNRHRPSVDVLFNSVAEVMGQKSTGVLLTGMGRDGAQGLLSMRKKGADTFVQDEATCVVFGMPKEALLIGAAVESFPIEHIAQRIFSGKKR